MARLGREGQYAAHRQVELHASHFDAEDAALIPTVDIPAAIVQKLLDYKEQFPSKPTKKGDFMFHEDDGAPVNPDYWLQDVFVPTAIKAGLRPATAIEGHSEQLVGLHTLRHTSRAC